MKGLPLCIIALALLLPQAIAFNCNSLGAGDSTICQSIQNNENLSQIEKDLLIADIFNQNKTFPNHDFIYYWNTALDIEDSPNRKYSSSGTINTAWVKIIALMPSVIENNLLYSSSSGKLMTAYNYKYNLPSGTEYRDCSTEYSLANKNEYTSVYLNNNLIGNGKLVSFNIYDNTLDNLTFKSELNIQIKYQVTHYRYKYVGKYKRCRYYSTEYRTDNLNLFDTLNAKLYKITPHSSFKVTDKYYNTTKGILEANNFTRGVLSFQNSSYENSKYIYSFNYSLPYYILTLKAERVDNNKINNIYVEEKDSKFIFTIKEASNCKIELFNHFGSTSEICDLSYIRTNFSIQTDRLNYVENETINITLFPKDTELKLTYGKQNITAKNTAKFIAEPYENKITAKLDDKSISIFVNVRAKEIQLAWYGLFTASSFIYIFYKFSLAYLHHLGV